MFQYIKTRQIPDVKRDIKYIVVHCTATRVNVNMASIVNFWREVLKWLHVGYHYMINYKGDIVQLASELEHTNGVKGYNHNSIHISYVGGVNAC